MLLLGLIGMVGVALLAYSYELSLVFLTVLSASLLTRVALRKLLLGLRRGSQESRVVTTFWGSTTLLLGSVLSLMAFFSFEEELSGITALEIVVPVILLVAVISFLVGLFILVFLRAKTGFPPWTAVLGAILACAALTVPSFFWFWGPAFLMRESRDRAVPPLDAFDVSYRADIALQGKVLGVEEEYEIQPKSHNSVVSVDGEWLSRTPGVSIRHIHSFEARESTGALTGLFVTVHREIEAERRTHTWGLILKGRL